MAKYKIGDEVKFKQDFGKYKVGDVVEVTGFKTSNHIYFIGAHGKGDCYTLRVESTKPKLTKNQRMTALENRVSELELIVHELRERPQLTTVINNAPQEPSTIKFARDITERFEKILNRKNDKTIESLTPNQQRAAIIEKAKKFVTENVANGRTSNRTTKKGNSTYRNNYYDVDFFVKERKVTAVVYWLAFNKKRFKKPPHVGRAKCSPNDVFNEHIGKAIALGRALNLDVSEFEQAVQPKEVVMGMDLEVRTNGEVDFTHKPIDKDDLFQCNHDFQKDESGVFIINDTKAIYEVES